MSKKKRYNGEGSIYKVKSGPRKGSWIAQLTVGINPETGNPKRKSFYGKTREEAKGKMEAYKEQVNYGLDVDGVKGKTYGEWLLEWMDTYKKPPMIKLATWENYMRYINNHVYPAIGEVPLSDLTTDHIQEIYVKMIRKELSPATIQRVHQVIHSSLEKAVQIRLLMYNPSKATERPPVRQAEVKAMTQEEMDIFLDLIEQQDIRWKAGFLVLIGTGLRIGELLALVWSDIDLEAGIIHVNKGLSRTKSMGLVVEETKTVKSNRYVPMPQVVIDALKELKQSQKVVALKKEDDNSLVFRTQNNTHIIPRNFQRKFEIIRDRAKISSKLHLHGLRYPNLNKIQTFFKDA